MLQIGRNTGIILRCFQFYQQNICCNYSLELSSRDGSNNGITPYVSMEKKYEASLNYSCYHFLPSSHLHYVIYIYICKEHTQMNEDKSDLNEQQKPNTGKYFSKPKLFFRQALETFLV